MVKKKKVIKEKDSKKGNGSQEETKLDNNDNLGDREKDGGREDREKDSVRDKESFNKIESRFFNKEVSNKIPKKIERVSSGIHNFDKLIENGFKKNSTNLIMGGTGTGKSIFGVQFLIEGIKKKEKCMFITFEETKNEFYSNMINLGFDLVDLEKKGMFFFLEYTPEKVKKMLEEGGGIIESIIIREKIQRIVIDSITSFGLLFERDLDKRGSSLALFRMLRKWQCTTVLTFQGDASRDRDLASRILEFESDGIILLYFLRNKKERERYLEILKMRGTNHSTKVYNFKIDKKGISLGSKGLPSGVEL
jgi:KaiC/GvpD/RAD55 family RecA-like ATPase